MKVECANHLSLEAHAHLSNVIANQGFSDPYWNMCRWCKKINSVFCLRLCSLWNLILLMCWRTPLKHKMLVEWSIKLNSGTSHVGKLLTLGIPSVVILSLQIFHSYVPSLWHYFSYIDIIPLFSALIFSVIPTAKFWYTELFH